MHFRACVFIASDLLMHTLEILLPLSFYILEWGEFLRGKLRKAFNVAEMIESRWIWRLWCSNWCEPIRAYLATNLPSQWIFCLSLFPTVLPCQRRTGRLLLLTPIGPYKISSVSKPNRLQQIARAKLSFLSIIKSRKCIRLV